MFNFFKNKNAVKRDILNHRIDLDSALEVRDVNFYYGDSKVVDNFSFDFKKNKIYSILGPAGSGKSTLAAHFNGLLKSSTANIYLFNGQNIYKFQKKINNFREIRRTVGMVLQNPEYQLFKETVLEDVCCGLKMLRIDSGDVVEKSRKKLIELGIPEELFSRNPFMLSGGQKKKIALAGILVIDPKVIIFDEPTLGLDPVSSQKIIDIILELKNQEKTVIVISNNVDILLEVGDEVVVMDKGKFIKSGKAYEIFRDPEINFGIPKIVKMVNELVEISPKYDYVLKKEPKNFEQLSNAIADVLGK